MEPEFLNGYRRPIPELPPDQNYQHNHGERHGQREPLERFVAKARWTRHCRGG